MPLPSDFDETLDRIQRLGIAAADAGTIRDHLVLAIRTSAEQGAASGDLSVQDLGFIEWSTRTLKRCEDAVHAEICQASGLKDKYRKLLDKATSDDNVKQIALVINNAIALINPALAVSSVVVYFALWITKVGLNYWCKQAVTI
jgi:hypothetical protein